MIKLSWDKLAILISFLVSAYISLDISYWRNDNRIIVNDVISYYAYLPSIFIYQDLSLKYLDHSDEKVRQKVWYGTTPNGGRVIKTTMGVSFFYLPFFLAANQYAIYSDKYSANGYSHPYRLAISCCSIFYLILALYFLRKFLVLYFSKVVVFWTILSIGIGTNLLNYTTAEPGMSHVFGLFLFSVTLYFYDRWLNDSSQRKLFLVGAFIGLSILMRPTNAIICIFLLFYKIKNFSEFKTRLNFLRNQSLPILKAIFIAFMVIVPQLLYWKYNSGSWIYFSYDDNENFFFNDPKIIEGLFSYRKGWLLYTPIMAFSLIGLFLRSERLKTNFAVGLLFLIHIYLIFSWWAWWFGGSFGLRAMIEIYPILAISLAVFYQAVLRTHFILKTVVTISTIALIYLNLFQTYQYREGLIHYEAMSKKTYWGVFLKHKHSENFWTDLEVPDYEAAKLGKRDL